VNSLFLGMENFRANFFYLSFTRRSSHSFKLRLYQHLSNPLRLKSKKRNSSTQWMALTSISLSPRPFGKSLMLRINLTNKIVSGLALPKAISNQSSMDVETIWKAWISTLASKVFRSFRMTGKSLASNKRKKQ